MANRRMISKSISVSAQVNSLTVFGKLLFTWMIPHADDYGRMSGNARVVRALVCPMADEDDKDVDLALNAMEDANLIVRYEVGGKEYIQFPKWETHQQGLHKRTASGIPAPPGLETGFSALERDVEAEICRYLQSGELVLGGMSVTDLDRQVRIGNSYLDIVAHTEEGATLLLEIKRQRLTSSSLDQIVGYVQLLKERGHEQIVAVLIGHGCAATLNLTACRENGVSVVTYDDNMVFLDHSSIGVIQRQITSNDAPNTLSHVNPTRAHGREENPREQNLTEQKGTEGTGTRRKSSASPDPRMQPLIKDFAERWAVANDTTVEAFTALGKGGATAGALKRLLVAGEMPDDITLSMVEFFASKQQFYIDKGYDVLLFAKDYYGLKRKANGGSNNGRRSDLSIYDD